jgi:hypothetical protein
MTHSHLLWPMTTFRGARTPARRHSSESCAGVHAPRLTPLARAPAAAPARACSRRDPPTDNATAGVPASLRPNPRTNRISDTVPRRRAALFRRCIRARVAQTEHVTQQVQIVEIAQDASLRLGSELEQHRCRDDLGP